MHDTIVVGAGPAGMTAALYLLRSGRKVLLVESDSFGGQIAASPKIENYPGMPRMSGSDFADALLTQVTDLGAEIEVARVTGLQKSGDHFEVLAESGMFSGKTVILATGVRHKKLELPEENFYIGRGISFCAVCDGPFHKGKTVAVVGGGNAALQEALYLSELCASVFLIHRRSTFRGEAPLLRALERKQNVTVYTDTIITGFSGSHTLERISVLNLKSREAAEIPVSALFEAVGRIPENEAFRNMVALDENGYIRASEDCITSCPGIFAAGDCRAKTIRQLTTAAADGTVDALAAAEYLK
ncbi:MAG: NAD(P)/FAD-dependent oxidoreductase [Clostridia bacterium]